MILVVLHKNGKAQSDAQIMRVDLAYLKGTNSDNVAYPMAMDEGSCVPREF